MIHPCVHHAAFKGSILGIRPGLPPLQEQGYIVPASFLLGRELSIHEGAHGQEDVRVGISYIHVPADVRDHPSRHELLPDETEYQRHLLFWREFDR